MIGQLPAEHCRAAPPLDRDAASAVRTPDQSPQPQPQPDAAGAFSGCCAGVSADTLGASVGPQHTQPQSQLVGSWGRACSTVGVVVVGVVVMVFLLRLATTSGWALTSS